MPWLLLKLDSDGNQWAMSSLILSYPWQSSCKMFLDTLLPVSIVWPGWLRIQLLRLPLLLTVKLPPVYITLLSSAEKCDQVYQIIAPCSRLVHFFRMFKVNWMEHTAGWSECVCVCVRTRARARLFAPVFVCMHMLIFTAGWLRKGEMRKTNLKLCVL